MLRPTRCVAGATAKSKEGDVAAEVCSSQTGYNSALFFDTFVHVYARTTYLPDKIPWYHVTYRLLQQTLKLFTI